MNYQQNAPRQRPQLSRLEHYGRQPNSPNPRALQQNLRERINESLPAVIIGSLLIFSGAVLLFWNEGSAVATTRSLDEGYKAVVKIQNVNHMDPENEERLVYLWGSLSILNYLQDSDYGIQVRGVKLKRRVQLYQWIEEESTTFLSGDPADSSETSYSYSQVWKDKLVDSSSFNIPWGHENPKSIAISSVVQTADLVNVGAYELSPAFKELFNKFTSFSADEPPELEEMKLHNGMYYLTRDIFDPETGDLRVQFYFAGQDGEQVTIIGKQSSNSIHPFITTSGKELLIMRTGKWSSEEMFTSEHAQNRFLTWVFRMAGWFLMFIGMASISTITQYLMILSPMLRDIIHLGLGSANLTLSMSLSLILIGGAWCFYKPGMALFILVVGTLPVIRALFSKRERRPAPSLRHQQHGRV